MTGATAERTPHTRFGKRLRAELDRQQISVRELARRLNRADPEGSRRAVARWLTSSAESAVNPSRASVRSVAEALGVDPASLASDDDEESDLPLSRDELSLFFDLLAKVSKVEASERA